MSGLFDACTPCGQAGGPPTKNRKPSRLAERPLSSGASHLHDAIKLLDSALPATIDKLDGSAFAPNMVAVALWLGAVIAAYLMLVAGGWCLTQTTGPVSKSDGAYRTSAVTAAANVPSVGPACKVWKSGIAVRRQARLAGFLA